MTDHAKALADALREFISNAPIDDKDKPYLSEIMHLDFVMLQDALAAYDTRQQDGKCFECGADLQAPICPKCNPEFDMSRPQASGDLVERLRKQAERAESGQDSATGTGDILREAADALSDWEKLKDPNTLHANILRNGDLRLTEAHLRHLLGDRIQQPDTVTDEMVEAALHTSPKDRPGTELVDYIASDFSGEPNSSDREFMRVALTAALAAKAK